MVVKERKGGGFDGKHGGLLKEASKRKWRDSDS